MKRVDLNFEIKDLDGKAIEEAPKASRIIANALLQGQNEDPVKAMDWALSLAKNGQLDLDNSDYEKFKKTVNEFKLPVITKAPVVKAINEAKSLNEQLKKS